MFRTCVAGALVLVVLTACGGSGEAAPTPQVLADKIGCADFEMSTGTIELGAREQASCKLGDESLTILTYKSNEPRDTAQGIADQFGGITVQGDRFAVRVDTQAAAEKVRGAVGGSIR